MKYTVKQLAEVAGISVRTLHHYDEIGLLKPGEIGTNGYRYYGEDQLIMLQQILFYKELDFSLDQIKAIISSSKYNIVEALKDQKKLLTLEKLRLTKLLSTIDNTIINISKNRKMTNDDMFGSLSKQQIEDYKKEARERWGDEVVNESEKRIKDWTKEDYKRAEAETDKMMLFIVENMEKGVDAPEIQSYMEQYYQGMQAFYDCSYEIFRNLGKMYVEDKRFTAFYNKYHPELAQFMCDAMAYYCDVKEGKK